MTRELEIRIALAGEIGMVVYEKNAIIAAFSSAAELSQWIEQRLQPFDAPADVAEPMPSMLQSAQPRPGLIRSIIGGKDKE